MRSPIAYGTQTALLLTVTAVGLTTAAGCDALSAAINKEGQRGIKASVCVSEQLGESIPAAAIDR